MIELRARTDEPISRCARCGWPDFDYVDTDNLEAAWMLPEALQRPNGFYAVLGVSSCRVCAQGHYFLELNMVDADVDETFRSEYLWFNGDIEPSAFYDAHRDGEKWFVTSYETPLGTMLHHFFGDFPLKDDFDETVKCGHQFLIDRWPELRALAQSL